MRPEAAYIAGKIENTAFIGLPETSLLLLICSLIFLMPMIAHMSTRGDLTPNFMPAICDTELAENDQRQDYLRGEAYQGADGCWHIKLMPAQCWPE